MKRQRRASFNDAAVAYAKSAHLCWCVGRAGEPCAMNCSRCGAPWSEARCAKPKAFNPSFPFLDLGGQHCCLACEHVCPAVMRGEAPVTGIRSCR